MSEQYPLLSEFSDEERLSPRFHRRRHLGMRGRAKYQLKGAAAIMTRWPDHWTALLTYWWIGLGMIAITTFLIYNTLFSIALFQPTNTKPTKYASFKTVTHTNKPSSPLAVYMHVFVNDKEEDLNKHISYIEIFANKYNDFTFNLIVVANDTSEATINLTDRINNDLAMNSLWTNDVHYGNLVPSNSNIKVKFVTLSKYLNESPLHKHWKNLPHQLIPFLVRAVSIWEKGGIAINPIILTPQSPHVAYIEKFGNIVNNFRKYKERIKHEKVHQAPIVYKTSPKVNNILDVINALESGNSVDSFSQETLNVAESRINETTTKVNKTNAHEKYAYPDLSASNEETTTKLQITNDELRSESPSHLLPLFWNYLFHNVNINPNNTTDSPRRQRRSPTYRVTDKDNTNVQMREFWNDIKGSDTYKPMIVSAKGIPNDKTTTISSEKSNNRNEDSLFELTVDLKGNMIATKTPCHAFVGNMFTDAIHHDETENLTDFIIKELSIFCKGLLASCVGIDVILV